MPTFRQVPLEAIRLDLDLAYRDQPGPNPEALRASLRRCGVLRPVRLLERLDGTLLPLTGFRRRLAARELGLTEIPAELVGPAPCSFDLFLQAVEEHAGETPPNLRERLRALRVAEQLNASPARLVGELLPALGLAAQPSLLEDLRRSLSLPESLLDLLVDKGFSLRRVLAFTRLEQLDGELLANLVRRLALGGRQIESMLSAVLELSARDGLPPRQLLAELDRLAEPDAAPALALARLEERRYPETTRRRRQLEALGAALAEQGATLRWHPSLADEGLELALRLSSLDDWPATLAALASDRTRELLGRALRVL